LEKNTFRLYIV